MHKEKTIGFLLRTYQCLKYDDCEDIIQDALLVFCDKIRQGKLDKIKSSLYTFFVGICKNKAREFARRDLKIGYIDDDITCGSFSQEKLDSILNLDNDEPEIETAKSLAVNEIINDLPAICAQVFWGYFRDGFSLKTLAKMYGKTESAMKVAKFRCSEKFKNRFQEVFYKILNK